MFSQLKIYIGIAVSAIVAILVGLVKYQSNRADNAEQEAETAESEAMHANQRAESQIEIAKVKTESAKRRVEDEKVIQQIKDTKIRPDNFSSNSLWDD